MRVSSEIEGEKFLVRREARGSRQVVKSGPRESYRHRSGAHAHARLERFFTVSSSVAYGKSKNDIDGGDNKDILRILSRLHFDRKRS